MPETDKSRRAHGTVLAVFWAAVRKDIRLLRRDRGALAGLFLLPVLFIVVFGNMLGVDQSENVWNVSVSVESRTADIDKVVRALEAAPPFRVELHAGSDNVVAAVRDGDAHAGLVFPGNFNPLNGVPAQLILDEAISGALRGRLEGMLSSLVGSAVLGSGEPLKMLEVRGTGEEPRVGKKVDGFQVAVPGNAVLFCFFLSVTVALSFISEKKTGTWRRVLAAPQRRRTLLLAKLVPYFLVGLVQMTTFFALGAFGFGMQVNGSLAALAALTVAVCMCAVALGLVLATFATTEKQVGGIGSLLVLTMGLVGGCMFPRLGMPVLMQKLGLAVPHGWALDGYYTAILRGGSGLADVTTELTALIGFTALFAVVGVARFRFEDG